MRILVTAGPTHEYIDDVRFISNPSSGRMGCAIARAAARRGHKVVLISGPVAFNSPAGVLCVNVTSAVDMHRAVSRRFRWCDCLMMTAAVGDFRPVARVKGKIKKEGKRELVLRLVRNPDILAECGRLKRKAQVLLGFALESTGVRRASKASLSNMLDKARAKLLHKNLDFVVLDSPSAFGASRLAAYLIPRHGRAEFFRHITKNQLAERLVRAAEAARMAMGE